MCFSDVIEQNIKKNTEECYLEDVQQFTIPLEDAFKELELADNEVCTAIFQIALSFLDLFDAKHDLVVILTDISRKWLQIHQR